MAFTDEEINLIYDRTTGYCHICHRKLAFKNYGAIGAYRAWEVEHSNPRARGGSNRLGNLYPACIPCNRSKGKGSTRAARAQQGQRRAPLSVEKRQVARIKNSIAGAVMGGLVGSIFGRKTALLGAGVGARIGYKRNPDKRGA